jgi:hypothetical protein
MFPNAWRCRPSLLGAGDFKLDDGQFAKTVVADEPAPGPSPPVHLHSYIWARLPRSNRSMM